MMYILYSNILTYPMSVLIYILLSEIVGAYISTIVTFNTSLLQYTKNV